MNKKLWIEELTHDRSLSDLLFYLLQTTLYDILAMHYYCFKDSRDGKESMHCVVISLCFSSPEIL